MGDGELLQLPGKPLPILPVVENVVFQNGNFPVQPGGGLLLGGSLFPHFLHLGGAVVDSPVVFLNVGGQSFQLLPGLILLGLGQGDFIPLLPEHPAGAVQGVEPQADFQGLFLLRQREEPLGLFRLLPERGNAAFQLADNVLQTQQIVFGLVQLALGVLLAVAEPGNPCGLLKDFPAVLGAGSHNAVDFALADYRVAVPAQARIHKEFVNVF